MYLKGKEGETNKRDEDELRRKVELFLLGKYKGLLV